VAENASVATQFQFTGFAVNRSTFEHLKRVPPALEESKPDEITHNFVVGAGIIGRADNKAEVRLGITVQPDPKWMPYKVEVEISGQFEMVGGGTPQLFENFCQVIAPTILFPYIREAVHRLTMDGRYGVLRLNPLNIQALLNSAEWKTAPIGEDAANASAPSQPSSQ
jgi:preprotein translocase subunit SecB